MREWIVEHGALLGPLLVVAAGLVPLAILLLLRRGAEASSVRHERAKLLATVTPLGEGDVALRGTLHKGATNSLTCGEQKVALVGPLRILHGSRAKWPRRQASPTHSLRDGDTVIAVGTCEPAPSTDAAAASYRSSDTTWVMRPAAETIDLFAIRPAIAPRSLGLVWSVAVVVACSLAGYGLMYSYCSSIDTMDSKNARFSVAQLHRDEWLPTSLVIASALPGTRDAALEQLDREMSYYRRTETTRDARIWIAKLRGCKRLVEVFTEETQFDNAAAAATSCNHPELALRALLYDGQYERAAALGSHSIRAEDRGYWVTAAIAAGKWSAAADVIDQLTSESSYAATRKACFVTWLRTRSGDPASKLALARQIATQPEQCGWLEGLLQGPDELHAQDAHHAWGMSEGAVAIMWANQPVDGDSNKLTRMGGTWSPWHAFHPDFVAWLAPFARPAVPDRAYWLAVRALLVGDATLARTEVANALNSLPEDSTLRDDINDLGRAIWLRTSATPVPEASSTGETSRFVALRNDPPSAELVRHVHTVNASNSDEEHAAVAAAMSGDAGPLVDLYDDESFLEPDTIPTLIALLPRVRLHRAELVAQLELSQPLIWELHYDDFPFQWLQVAALRRDALRVAGNAAAASRWQQLIARHAKALADRERLVALILWHDFSRYAESLAKSAAK